MGVYLLFRSNAYRFFSDKRSYTERCMHTYSIMLMNGDEFIKSSS